MGGVPTDPHVAARRRLCSLLRRQAAAGDASACGGGGGFPLVPRRLFTPRPVCAQASYLQVQEGSFQLYSSYEVAYGNVNVR